MLTEQKVLKIIESVLNEISDDTFLESGKYYCGSELNDFKPFHIYETSLTEKIVKKLSYYEDIIGWEVNYPKNAFKNSSYSVADFAYGHIDKHYFKSVFEIKKWYGDKSTQYYVWKDILKLYRYTSEDYEQVGTNKYMLVLYTGPLNNKEEIAGLVEFYFVNPTLDSLNYSGHDISDAMKKLALDSNWKSESIDLLLAKYDHVFSNLPLVEFREEFMLHDSMKKVFAFVLKLKD